MARTKKVELSKASNLGDEDISRFRLGEVGYVGLPVFNGVSNAEIKSELNHPNSLKTYKTMSYHPSVNAPLSLFSNMVSKATFRFVPPKDATEDEKKITAIVESMFKDMDQPFENFIEEAMTFTQYGWSVIEKVYRKRTTSSGSMYNDGLIGIRKLALRSQESIEKFIFDDTGNEVIAVKQNLSGLNDPYNQFKNRKELIVTIPRSKFMLFNLGRNRSNPYGTSPLRDAYLPWRYLQAIEELEATSVVKDINGLPVLRIPAQYMSSDATAEQKAIYENFKRIMRNLQQGSQSSMILPSTMDPETRSELFKIELLSQDGKKNFSLSDIKNYYSTQIYTALGADILILGNTQSSSFSLGTLKNTQASNVAEGFLKRIVQVINEDLIKQIYSLNNWPLDRQCKIDYEGFEGESLDEIGKYIQRSAAVGMLSRDLDTVNFVRNSIGLDALPEGTNLEEVLTDFTSRSSDGMTSGLNSGVGDTAGTKDDSTNNAENAS